MVDDTASTLQEQAVEIDVLANDFDLTGSLDSSSVQVVLSPSYGTATLLDDGRIRYLPQWNWYGADKFMYSCCDVLKDCDTAQVTVHVIANQDFDSARVIYEGVDRPTALAVIDVDDDTDPDVVFAGYGDYEIRWAENNGAGEFDTTHMIHDAAVRVRDMHPLDMDEDGDLDFISAEGNRIAWYENDSGGFDSVHLVTDQITEVGVVHAADLFGSTLPDIVFMSQNYRKVVVVENLGGDLFGGAQFLNTYIWEPMSLPESTGVHIHDLDGDGDNDVLGVDHNRPYKNGFTEGLWSRTTLVWYENLGSGGFRDGVRIGYDINIDVQDIHTADINLDGAVDVLAGIEEEVVWFENQGGGFFNGASTIGDELSSLRSIHTTDLDGDGWPDVIASCAPSRVIWYRNDGGDGFEPGRLVADETHGVTRFVRSADVDGDGDQDIIAAQYDLDRIVWYENILTPKECPDVPEDLSTLIAGPTMAKVAWKGSSEMNGYVLQAKPIDGNKAHFRRSADTIKVVKPLQPGTTYLWRVRAECPSGKLSRWSVTDTFSTTSPRESTATDRNIEVRVLPNPASDRLVLIIRQAMSEEHDVVLLDALGRELAHYAGVLGRLELPVVKWPNGLYYLRITSSDAQRTVPVFIQRSVP